MNRHRSLACVTTLIFASTLAILGCQSPLDSPSSVDETDRSANPEKVVARITGGGRYLFANTFDIQFSIGAVERDDGTVSGSFHQKLDLGGQLVEIHGRVTCLTFDEANGRAWVGGVVTENNSEHPDFQVDITQPGRDVWFRVLDTDDSGTPDRTTFLGFEGGGGIITSEEYCEAAIWPDDNARTHPVTQGGITVTP